MQLLTKLDELLLSNRTRLNSCLDNWSALDGELIFWRSLREEFGSSLERETCKKFEKEICGFKAKTCHQILFWTTRIWTLAIGSKSNNAIRTSNHNNISVTSVRLKLNYFKVLRLYHLKSCQIHLIFLRFSTICSRIYSTIYRTILTFI